MAKMNQSRKKTIRRRWLLVGGVALLLIVMAGGLYGYRKVRHIRHIDGLKDAGYVSLEHGEPIQAYHEFRGYLGRHPEDVEALKGLIQAVQAFAPDQQISPIELVNIYRQLIALEPGNHSARAELLELYHQINFAKEAIDLAGGVLEEDEAHVRAREIRALQHTRLRQYALAIQECQLLLEHEPEHLNTRLLLLELMVQNNELDTDVLAWGGDLSAVIDWQDSRPNYDAQSPTSKLIQGYAYQLTGQAERAVAVYEGLVASDLDDSQVVRVLAQLLEQVGRADAASTLLTHAAAELDADDLRPELARRLWERYRVEEILAAFDENVSDVLDEPGSYPFVIYSLYRSGEAVKADELLKQGLASKDMYVQTWAGVFSAIQGAKAGDAERLATLSEVRQASERYPNDAHLRAEYAQQLLQSGYVEAAVVEWERVAADARGWSRPMQRIAEIMLATQRDAMALEPARDAVRRAPKSLESILVYFRAITANLERLSVEDFNRVLGLIDQVQAQVDSEVLLPIQIELAARGRGDQAKEDAQAQLRAMMADEPQYAMETWIALIRVSQRHDLGEVSELIEQAHRQHGANPKLALTRAVEELTDGTSDGQAVLAIFDQWRAEADEPDALAWQLARARLARIIDPNQATAIWGELIERFPDETLIRVQALQDEANWREEGLTLIRRLLSNQTVDAEGHEIAPVRIARARLMLADAESGLELEQAVRYLAETSRTYPYLSEPYSLLGLCYERQGNRSKALDAYTSAHRIRPGSEALLSSRVRLHRELGEMERANNLITQYAEEFASSARADPARLAQTFMMVGDMEQAIRWAEKAIQKDESDRRSALMLARLYLAADRPADAERLYRDLLQSPDLDVIIAASSFYLQTGRQDEAEALIARLDGLDLDETTKAVFKGDFSLTTGDLDSARVQYEKAADRGDLVHATTAFVRLISIQLSQGDLNGVMQVAKAAHQKVPHEKRFKALAENEVLIRSVYSPTTAPFLNRLLANPDQRPVVEAALRIMREMASLATGEDQGDADVQERQRLLVELRRLADQNQRVVELQNLLVRQYIEAGQSESAVEIASRSAQMFPKNESVLMAAADANMSAQRWDNAAIVGEQIAKLNPSYQASADMVSARAAIQRGLPNEAVRLIEPHLEMASQAPTRYEPIIRVSLAASIAANRGPDGLPQLKSVVLSDKRWRTFVLDQIIRQESCRFDTAEAWIAHVLSQGGVGSGDAALTMKAATAWHTIGIREDSGQAAQKAEAILSSLEAHPEVGFQAVLFRAIFAEERGELKDAEQGYRQVLQTESGNLIALNNLSMVLVHLGKANEALPFAKRAVKGAPNAPIVLDTLANVQLATGNAGDAERTINQAIDLDPEGVAWHITRCRALIAKQDPLAATEAVQAYEHIGVLINALGQIDDSLSQEYLSLRTELDQLLGSSTGAPATRE